MMLLKREPERAKSSRLEMLIEKINQQSGGKAQPAAAVAGERSKSGEGSSPLSGLDQASPASSCQSSLSDAADAADEGGYTLGATPTTPYECDVCRRAFARSSLLGKHIQTHTEQLQFSCPYCRRLFKHKRSRDRHTKLHTGDKKYKCLHCESAFARSDHLKIHMKTHDNRKPHQCELCNRGYNTAAALASHQQHHSKQEARRCGSGSGSSCPSPSLLEKSDAARRPEALEAPAASPPPDSLAPKVACVYCGKEFLSMAQMCAHAHAAHRSAYASTLPMTAHHPQPALGARSPRSPRQDAGRDAEDLSPQTRPSSSTPTYACDRCTMRFASSPHLREHVESVHCTSSCSTRYRYDAPDEKRDTHEEELLQLEQKPTDLSRKRRHGDEPKRAEKRHAPDAPSPYEANDKPCICSYCYAQMPNFKMFLLHMETHVIHSVAPTIQKPPACPLCGESANSALELGRHIFGHAIANVAAYCCHACKQPFDKMDHLRKHLLDAHAQTIYKCTICNDTFDTEQSLQMHFGSKHAVECKHFRCNLCSDQVFHDRLTAELHVNMKHSLISPHPPSVTPTAAPLLGFLRDEPRSGAPYHQCPFCQKLFKDEYLQYLHILREHNHRLGGVPTQLEAKLHAKLGAMDQPLRFRCNICQKTTSSESELATHKKLHHSKLRSVSLQCAYCNEHCKSRSDLEHHMKTHQVAASGKGKHKCNICDEIFASATTLAEHKLSHCKIVAGNSCTQCKTLLGDEQSFYSHQLQHGTSSSGTANSKNLMSLPANCIVCCQTLQTDVEIRLHAGFHLRHLRQHPQAQGQPHGRKEYLCVVCNKMCEGGQVHAMHHVYVCKDCAAMAPHANGSASGGAPGNRSPLKSPSKSPSKSTPNSTAHANTASTANHSSAHHLDDAGSSASTSLECHLCRNALPTPIKLQVHLIEHNFMGIGQYRCYVCSSVFTTAAGLRGHIVEHGPDTRPYECAECAAKFYFETELENHKFAHLQHAQAGYEKLVECTRCGASVSELAYYAEHIHTCLTPSAAVNSTANAISASSNGIVNIKVESSADYEAREKIKTEGNGECHPSLV